MKKIFMLLISLLCLCTIGCATAEKSTKSTFESNESGTYNNISIPVKDFIVKGPIYVESIVTISNGEKNGSEITAYMLMKEAEKLDADDVVNVKIDKVENINKEVSRKRNMKKVTKTKTITYKATALAIKYK